MEYKFPEIENINCILDAIEGYDEFIVNKNYEHGLITVNYVFNTEKTFLHPDNFEAEDEKIKAALRKECRGIEFDLDSGKLVTRKFHKFFNVNQNEESMSKNIKWSQRHWVLDKLDGSMVTFYKRKDGGIQAHTKMGRTPVAEPINKFVDASSILYKPFFEACLLIGVTPLFEWCSRQQKIVVDYAQESLILTAMRYNFSGEYFPYDKMKTLASIYKVPCVKAHETSIDEPNDFLKNVSSMENAEGVVIRFESGHMYKVKADWYMRLHNSIDLVKFEKNIVDILINDMLDDLRPIMVDTTREPMEKFAEDFYENLANEAKRLDSAVKEYKSNHDKKTFALQVAPTLNKQDVGLIFKIWQGEDAITAVKNMIKKNCGSRTAIDSVRKYFGDINWMDYYNAQPSDED